MAFDFPNSPTVGQTFQGYTWDGEKWVATTAVPNTAGVIGMYVFTANGTYVPSPSMTSAAIEAVGSGGGGGGVGAAGAGVQFTGGGGGSGSYSRSTLTAAQIGSSQAVTIGAAGNGGAAGVNAGQAGGDVSFGSLVIAKGGGGGGASGAGGQSRCGLAGVAGTGNFTAAGAPGAGGMNAATATIALNLGWGGSSIFGGGAPDASNAASGPGNNASGYGSGGGGGYSFNGAAQKGGNGSPGIVIVTEYGMTALAAGAGQGSVRYDLPQGLTAPQRQQARANIDALKKNYIVNGAMMVSQENGVTAGTTSGYYPVDQFLTSISGTTGVVTFAQVASDTPAGSPNRIRATVTTADAVVGATDFVALLQPIEGLRIADLRAGTAAAKTVVLQFGVKAPAGTYCVAFKNAALNRAYVAEYVIAAGEANTDTMKQVVVPLDVTGTWAKDNTRGLTLWWGLMVGATFQVAANAWAAGDFYASANQFDFMGTTGNVFELFDVGLYEGGVAPLFQVPDYVSELAVCKRYWQQSPTRFVPTATSGITFDFPVQMRIAPVVTGGGAGFAAGAVNTNINGTFYQTTAGYQNLVMNARL